MGRCWALRTLSLWYSCLSKIKPDSQISSGIARPGTSLPARTDSGNTRLHGPAPRCGLCPGPGAHSESWWLPGVQAGTQSWHTRTDRSQHTQSNWAALPHAPGHSHGQDHCCQSQPRPLQLQMHSWNQRGFNSRMDSLCLARVVSGCAGLSSPGHAALARGCSEGRSWHHVSHRNMRNGSVGGEHHQHDSAMAKGRDSQPAQSHGTQPKATGLGLAGALAVPPLVSKTGEAAFMTTAGTNTSLCSSHNIMSAPGMQQTGGEEAKVQEGKRWCPRMQRNRRASAPQSTLGRSSREEAPPAHLGQPCPSAQRCRPQLGSRSGEG